MILGHQIHTCLLSDKAPLMRSPRQSKKASQHLSQGWVAQVLGICMSKVMAILWEEKCEKDA